MPRVPIIRHIVMPILQIVDTFIFYSFKISLRKESNSLQRLSLITQRFSKLGFQNTLVQLCRLCLLIFSLCSAMPINCVHPHVLVIISIRTLLVHARTFASPDTSCGGAEFASLVLFMRLHRYKR